MIRSFRTQLIRAVLRFRYNTIQSMRLEEQSQVCRKLFRWEVGHYLHVSKWQELSSGQMSQPAASPSSLALQFYSSWLQPILLRVYMSISIFSWPALLKILLPVVTDFFNFKLVLDNFNSVKLLKQLMATLNIGMCSERLQLFHINLSF